MARVGGLNDGADRLLIEPLESAFALEILQVTADGAFTRESGELGFVDQARAQESLSPFAPDRPALAFGERLFKEGKVGERFHGGDLFGGELVAQEIVIEPAFQVMHPGVEEALAVQAHEQVATM